MSTSTEKSKFYSSGKLLLTGEYLILCGAKGLAIPTRLGQRMQVTQAPGKDQLIWKASLSDGSNWFEAHFDLPELHCTFTTDTEKSDLLLKILPYAAHKFSKGGIFLIETMLEFDPAFGLGSSSTFLTNFAKWAKINPFDLLRQTFGGSGYDLAVGMSGTAITFCRTDNEPHFEAVDFSPAFKDDLMFIYSGQKKISRDAIRDFNCRDISPNILKTISEITEKMQHCSDLAIFEDLIEQHEALTGLVLGLTPIKQSHFPDFAGSLKSLGAWGGDFFMATRKTTAREYFSNKGYTIMFDWNELIK
jgi:mevalonate kinase